MKYIPYVFFWVCGFYAYPRVQEVGWQRTALDAAWGVGMFLLLWFALWAIVEVIERRRVSPGKGDK